MAPEVIISRTYDQPVDVWSFGCVLAHMATGRAPYSHLGRLRVEEVLTLVAEGTAAPDHMVGEATPHTLHELIRNCKRFALVLDLALGLSSSDNLSFARLKYETA